MTEHPNPPKFTPFARIGDPAADEIIDQANAEFEAMTPKQKALVLIRKSQIERQDKWRPKPARKS